MELWLDPVSAEVLGTDENGHPVLLKNRCGAGTIYLLAAPLEEMLVSRPGSFCDPGEPAWQDIYRIFSQEVRKHRIAQSRVPQVVITEHRQTETEAELVAINYTNRDLPLLLDVKEGWKLTKVFAPDQETVPHNGACVLHAEKMI